MHSLFCTVLATFWVVFALPCYSLPRPDSTYSGQGGSNYNSTSGSTGKTVTYDWSVGWTTAAPDGFERPVIGINGQWPCPELHIDLGDTVIINVYNGLGNQSTSIHWHGIHQYGTSEMDGSIGASQCPVAPGQTFTYKWTANQTGSYWYHSHVSGQYPDGLWGPLIIHDPNPPFEYDEEFVLTLSDWYHDLMPTLLEQYQSHAGEALDGTPTPDGGALMNSGKNITIPVKPNTTYLIHVICPAAFSGVGFIFEGHPITTVEIDGTYTQKADTNGGGKLARVAPGQRQSVLITTKNTTNINYAIFATLDVNMLFLDKGVNPPASYNTNVTGWLVYNEDAPLPPAPIYYELGNSDFFEDLDYIPYDNTTVWGPVDRQIIMNTIATNISGISRFAINNSTYIGADVPSLYTALTVGDDYASNPIVYGDTNPYIFKYGEVVEIVLNNQHTNLHPWHLHGHFFQVLERTTPNTGSWPGSYSNYSNTPVIRDTIMLQPNSYTVVRFIADNPGVWLWHCHIEFHVPSGLSATFIEAPEQLIGGAAKIPDNHINVCKAYPMPYEGNAAGNSVNLLNVTGEPDTVPQDQYGSTYPPVNGSSSGSTVSKRGGPRKFI